MLPGFVVIGAMKSGTTSLHRYLDAHPAIAMSKPKEPDYFIAEKNYDEGLTWYESHFDDSAEICGESGPNYTKCHLFGGVPERMYDLLPDAKLVYLLRDPLDRIVSHYVHNRAQGRERQTLDEALDGDLEKNNYVNCSKYHMQLKVYENHYPREQIGVWTTADLRHRRQSTLQSVFRFLKVDDAFSDPAFFKEHHQSSNKSRSTPVDRLLANTGAKRLLRSLVPSPLKKAYKSVATRSVETPSLEGFLEERVKDELAPDVRRLRAWAGHDFAHWRL